MRKSAILLAVVGVLVFAAGAGAASRWVITSTKQIKPSVLRQLKGAKGAKGARGATGPKGPAGPAGASGAAGVVPAIVTVDSATLTLQPGQSSYDVDPTGWLAQCPSGYSVLGTGYLAAAFDEVAFVINYGSFVGGFIYDNGSIASQVHVQATCGQVPGGSSGAHVRHMSGGGADPHALYAADLKREAAAG